MAGWWEAIRAKLHNTFWTREYSIAELAAMDITTGEKQIKLSPLEWIRLKILRLDATGDIKLPGDTGYHTVTEDSATAILAQLELTTGFYLFEKTFTADGGGTLAATELLAAPGAGNVYVIGSIYMGKVSAASANGTATVTCDAETLATFSTVQNLDHKPVPLNLQLASTAAVNVAGGNLGAATKIDVAVTYKVVTA